MSCVTETDGASSCTCLLNSTQNGKVVIQSDTMELSIYTNALDSRLLIIDFISLRRQRDRGIVSM